MAASTLPIPARLTALLNSGAWPRTTQEAIRQNLKPLVSPERIKRFAPHESNLYLLPPPFPIVQSQLSGPENQFWTKFAALEEIAPELSLVIGDFGLGSDCPLILDYRTNPSDPAVLGLRWSGERGGRNTWITAARGFNAFADLIALDKKPN